MAEGKTERGHLYEIDLVRVVTAIGVVGVHATYFTLSLNSAPLGFHLQNGVVAALHFTREVFLSITAFVLVYVYAGRPFSGRTFWRKRGLGVLVPYVFWSLVYTWQNVPHNPPLSWLRTAMVDIATGTASYQLYFILLSLEFYLVMPLFLPWLEGIGRRHPWRVLVGSGALQLAMLYADHNFLQAGSLAATHTGQLLNSVQAGFLPLYQFYAVLGGLGALHAKALHDFVRRHGSWVVLIMAAGLGALWVRYGLMVWIQHRSDDYATSVFQPVMVFYSAAVALFLYWVGVVWATRRSPGPPPGLRLWTVLSNASFGVYLIHPILLGLVLTRELPLLPATLPVALRVGTVWASAAGLTMAVCVVMLYVPVLSRLIGRPGPRVGTVVWGRWLSGLAVAGGTGRRRGERWNPVSGLRWPGRSRAAG